MDDVLVVRELKKYYPMGKRCLKAVDGVSFRIPRGTALGLVGESGCGKSTTGRMVLRLGGPLTAGSVELLGQDLYAMSPRQLRQLRPKMQMIFQDPFSSLSPRLSVGELIGEAVAVHKLVPKGELVDYVNQIMTACGLSPDFRHRYPHEFSGGQRQRICIARALALQPSFVVCDEPVSALDVSVQAQIVNLLKQLQQQRQLTYLFISHDLSVVSSLCDRVAVMYYGRIVEYGETDRVISSPVHPYTADLIESARHPGGRSIREKRAGEPSLEGCGYYQYCSRAAERCLTERGRTDMSSVHSGACLMSPHSDAGQ